MQRKGQKTTLVIHDPCPGYIPPSQRASHSHSHHTHTHTHTHEQDQSHHQYQYHHHHASPTAYTHDYSMNEGEGEGEDEDMAGMDLDMDEEHYSHSHSLNHSHSHSQYCSESEQCPGQSNELQEVEVKGKQVDEKSEEQSNGFPTVVLDCANIGWAYGVDSFSPVGLSIVYKFFQDFHVNVIGFIPASYYTRRPKDGSRSNPMKQVAGWDILDELVRSNQMVIVPAGDSDDLYILQYARMNDGFVVSNDFFVDHVRSLPSDEASRQAKVWLEQFRCAYTFIKSASSGGGTFMPSPASAMMELLERYRKGVPGFSGGEVDNDEDEMEMDFNSPPDETII